MIKKITLTERDREELEHLKVNPQDVQDDHYDYSKVVVKKPWGYEYLIFSNEVIAVWILYLKTEAQTSMHCHLGKKTSLAVLQGKVTCSSLTESVDLTVGEGLLIEKGVFHQTAAISDGGAFVMELETPVNKRDLARLSDKYGRKGKGYETEDQHSFNTQNYNHISFQNSEIQHNLKKRFGQCSITFKEVADEKSLDEILELNPEDVVCILRGQLLCPLSHTTIDVGDTMTVAALKKIGPMRIGRNIEALVIKKIDRFLKISLRRSFLNELNIKPVFLVPGEAMFTCSIPSAGTKV